MDKNNKGFGTTRTNNKGFETMVPMVKGHEFGQNRTLRADHGYDVLFSREATASDPRTRPGSAQRLGKQHSIFMKNPDPQWVRLWGF